jgi:hypothetical protein
LTGTSIDRLEPLATPIDLNTMLICSFPEVVRSGFDAAACRQTLVQKASESFQNVPPGLPKVSKKRQFLSDSFRKFR